MVLYAEYFACQAGGWTMNLRQAVTEDRLLLSTLSMDVQRLHAEKHPGIFKMPQREDYAVSFFEEMLADPAARILIAEEAAKAVGYILCRLVERMDNPFTFPARILLVDQISVAPEARRSGIGTALLEAAVLLARDLKAQRIVLDSWDFNSEAHTFFERLGFRRFNFRFWRHL
jgi:ribosomal protein S18 acetylase RimI-like enzyme